MKPKNKQKRKYPLLINSNPKIPWATHTVALSLPLCSGKQALQFIHILGELDRAMWCLYGDSMVNELNLYGVEWSSDPDNSP